MIYLSSLWCVRLRNPRSRRICLRLKRSHKHSVQRRPLLPATLALCFVSRSNFIEKKIFLAWLAANPLTLFSRLCELEQNCFLSANCPWSWHCHKDLSAFSRHTIFLSSRDCMNCVCFCRILLCRRSTKRARCFLFFCSLSSIFPLFFLLITITLVLIKLLSRREIRFHQVANTLLFFVLLVSTTHKLSIQFSTLYFKEFANLI